VKIPNLRIRTGRQVRHRRASFQAWNDLQESFGRKALTGLVPVFVAAAFAGVSKRRIQELIEAGRLQCGVLAVGGREVKFLAAIDLLLLPVAAETGQLGLFGTDRKRMKKKKQRKV
jgi:hypothetical protein